MNLFIGHTTALLFWRAVGERRLPRPKPSGLSDLASCATGSRQARQADLTPLGVTLGRLGLERPTDTDGNASILPAQDSAIPLDILVPSASKTHIARGVDIHVLSSTLPHPAFCQIDNGLFVTSPELTVIQNLDRRHALPNIELVMELCGTYALDSHADMLTTDRPVTSLERLREASDAMRHGKGVHIARRTIAHAANGARSPRETETFLMLTLPSRLGGYGLPKPSLNQKVPVAGDAMRFTDDGYYLVDLLYVDERIVVEYDGRDFHQQLGSIERDKRRRSVLAAMGYAVIVISAEDTTSERLFRQKAEQVAALLGIRLPTLDKEGRARRATLFQWLFDPRHPHLPFGHGY